MTRTVFWVGLTVLLLGCGRQDFEGLWSGKVCESLPMEMDLDTWGHGSLNTIAPIETENEDSALIEVELEIEVTQDFRAYVESMQSHDITLGAIEVRRQVMTGNMAWDPTYYGPCTFEIALE